MKFTLLSIIILSSSFSLFAQDLNLSNTVQIKVKKKKEDRKTSFAIAPSVTYLIKPFEFQSNYIAVLDSGTNLNSDILFPNITKSNILYNLGVQFNFKLNKRFNIGSGLTFSFFPTKWNGSIQVPLSPNIIYNRFLGGPNYLYIGVPLHLNYCLNQKLQFGVGISYLHSLTSLPIRSVNGEILTKVIPISGLLKFDYKLMKRTSLFGQLNFGCAFYTPSSLNFIQNIYADNQFYFLRFGAKNGLNAVVSNSTVSLGLKFQLTK